jgi:hypothetical protein
LKSLNLSVWTVPPGAGGDAKNDCMSLRDAPPDPMLFSLNNPNTEFVTLGIKLLFAKLLVLQYVITPQ